MARYDHYIRRGDSFIPAEPSNPLKILNPGVYKFMYDRQNDILFFNLQRTNHDDLIDLPSQEFEKVVGEMDVFLKPETKGLFDRYGYLYKRSTLLYGAPGTGKTCIVNRICQKVIEGGGIVLFDPSPEMLPIAYKAIDDIQPDTNVLVIFEELDKWLANGDEGILSILDGEIQRPNTIYLATTNYIDRIPARVCRPGRFSSMIQVGFPSPEARKFYLDIKLGNDPVIPTWVEKTEGLSIDELKETVLAVKCLGQPLDDVVEKIHDLKKKKDYLEDMEDDDDY